MCWLLSDFCCSSAKKSLKHCLLLCPGRSLIPEPSSSFWSITSSLLWTQSQALRIKSERDSEKWDKGCKMTKKKKKKRVADLFLVVPREHGADGSPSGAQKWQDSSRDASLQWPQWALGSTHTRSTQQEMMGVEPWEEGFLGLTGDISHFQERESSMCGSSSHLSTCHGKVKKNKS